MKKNVALMFICGGMMAVWAEGRTVVMNVKTGAGVSPIEVTTGSRVTFSSDLTQMIVDNGTAEKARAFDIDGIENIVFTVNSGTELVETTLNELKVSANGRVLTISGAGRIDYAVWDTSGIPAISGTGSGTVSIDFSTLKSGIYIIKANNTTLKYVNH